MTLHPIVVLLDEFGAQPLLDLLDVLGGWPVIAGESWDEDSWDLVEVLSKNRLELDYNFLFAHKIIQDITNSDMNIMMVSAAEVFQSLNKIPF